MKLNTVFPQRHPVREPDGVIIETPLDPATLSHSATGHGRFKGLDYSHSAIKPPVERDIEDALPTLPDKRPVTP